MCMQMNNCFGKRNSLGSVYLERTSCQTRLGKTPCLRFAMQAASHFQDPNAVTPLYAARHMEDCQRS